MIDTYQRLLENLAALKNETLWAKLIKDFDGLITKDIPEFDETVVMNALVFVNNTLGPHLRDNDDFMSAFMVAILLGMEMAHIKETL